MGRISDYLAEQLRARLDQVPVVVWYDPERAFVQCFSTLDLTGVVKLEWRHGPLDLRRQAEPFVRGLREGSRPPQSLLVYVPMRRAPDRANALLSLEVLGVREERSLYDVARSALVPSLGPAKVDSWLRLPDLTLAKLEELASADSTIGALQAVFGPASPREVGLAILRNPEKVHECSDRTLLPDLKRTLFTTFGVQVGAALSNAASVTDAFAARVLLTEFLVDLTTVPSVLQHLLPLPEGSQLEACRDLALKLRADRNLEAAYREWATRACDTFALDRPDYDAQQLGLRDTFRFEAEYALAQAKALGHTADWAAMRDWIARRSDSYWSAQDPALAQAWDVLRLAGEVMAAADQGRAKLPSVGAPPADWVARYVDDSSAGLWQVDRLARRLDVRAGAGDEVDEALVERARDAAYGLEQLATERFCDALAACAEPLAGLPEQADIVRGHVLPAVQGQKVALVIADALRYEMARDLAEALTSTGEVRVQHAIASLPSTTLVGMAALTPAAASGLTLAPVNTGKVVPHVAGAPMFTVDQRMASFSAEFGGRFRHVTLDEVLPMKRKRLAELVESVDLLVVRSGEIDAAGEQDTLATARRIMGHLLEQIQQAIQRLAAAGIQRFFVVADHGFLMREDIGAGMIIDPPGTGALEVHRRFAIGRGLGATANAITFRAAALGLGGDLELAFPRGINVFRTPGNTAYLHGGVSLQELIVPVVWYSPTAVPERTGSQAVDVGLKDERRIANRLFAVTLSYEGGGLFEQDRVRWFRVTGYAGDTMVAEPVQALEGYRAADGAVGLTPNSRTVVMMQVSELEGNGKLELRVTDVDAGETVKTRKVDYDFAF